MPELWGVLATTIKGGVWGVLGGAILAMGFIYKRLTKKTVIFALLLMMVAQVTHLELGEFVHTLGDAHIYVNHFEQINLQLSRETKKLPIYQKNSRL